MRDSVRTFVLMVGAFSASLALAQSNHLNRPSGLDTRDVPGLYSERFQLIYLGRFDELRASYGFTNVLPHVFSHSALGWSIKCARHLAPDSPTFPVTVTTVNGYGTEIYSHTRNHKIDARFAEKIREYGLPYQNGTSYERLFERNGCDSPATRQYLDNLLRLAYGKPPVQQSRTSPR